MVTAVLDDADMPEIPGVGAVEAVLNPIGALTRKNLGQLIETHLGWVARHAPNGKEWVRDETWPATKPIDRALLEEWLGEAKPVDETGKVRVRLRRGGPPTELPVVVGYQYLMKLNHLAEKKVVFRSVGEKNGPPDYDAATLQPPQGRRRRGGQRLGEMEMWALAAWNVPAVLAESVTLKSDDLASRNALRKIVTPDGAEKAAEAPAEEATHLTESWRTLFFLLLGVGIRVGLRLKSEPGGGPAADNWLEGQPIRIDDVEKMELSLLDDDALRGRMENAGITNPLAEEYRSWVELECGHSGYQQDIVLRRGCCKKCETVLEKTYLDNGVWRNQPCGHTGGRKGDIARYKGYCGECEAEVRGKTKRTVRVPVEGGLLDPGIWPAGFRKRRRGLGVIDLQVSAEHKLIRQNVRYVPVVPPHVRTPRMERGYRDLLREIRRGERRGNGPAENRAGVEKAFKRLVDAFADALNGKKGFVRKCLLGKRVDLSGRAVIVPDPTLRLDECGLPEAMRGGAEERPVLLNRAPSLHRYNLHAFEPTFHGNSVIALHPALCGRFAADFDGDTMACHVVVGEQAAEEALEKMRPSKSLRSSAAGQALVHVEQETLAGIAYLMLRKPAELTTLFEPCGGDLATLGGEVREWATKGPQEAAAAMKLGFDAATSAGLSVGWADIPAGAGGRVEAAGGKGGYEGRAGAEKWVAEELEKWRTGGKDAEGAVLALLIRSGALRSPEKGVDLLMELAVARGSFERLAGGRTEDVRGCLANGLENAKEWFAAAFGGRKGLADKKLVTPIAGSLTRDLVWAAKALVIGPEEDCGTEERLVVVGLHDGERELLSDRQWKGRRDQEPEGRIRSPVLCAGRDEGTICRRCYGPDVSGDSGQAPEPGYPIGLVAAQSVGERGTQLAMRTFHASGRTEGGLASGLERICALFRGQKVGVQGTEDDNAWDRVAKEGGCEGPREVGLIPRRLADLTEAEDDAQRACNGLVRVFLFEMYQSYRVVDVAPIHFETLLAALLSKGPETEGSGGRLTLEGVRTRAEKRASFLEQLGFGGVSRSVRKQATALRESTERARSSSVLNQALSRMLGRKGVRQ